MFDPSKFEYYDYAIDDEYNSKLKNADYSSQGTVLFNIFDSRPISYSTHYDIVKVTPKKFGTSAKFGAKYTHTYNINNKSTTGTAAITWGQGMNVVSGSITYSVTTTSSEANWEISDTNSLRIP